MEKLTYKQAYDKIIQAYFRDEIKPLDSAFCFCGTLNRNDNSYWRAYLRKADGYYYTGSEFQRMEDALLGELRKLMPNNGQDDFPMIFGIHNNINYEYTLFAGMSAALEVLKEIHRSRGEDVDEVPVFVKRELVTPIIHSPRQ